MTSPGMHKIAFVAEMSAKLDIEITGVEHPKQAVVGSDLVVSLPIVKHPQPTIL